MADVCEVESELGGLVYQSLGTVSFSHPEEAADFPVPPGYARLVAVSSRYGLTVLADHAGLCVAHTARLAEVCESLKEKLPAEQIVPGDDFTRVPLRGASHVSFSPDERTLAAVAGCAVHLFQTKDADGSRSPDGAGGASAAAAFRTQVLGDDDEAVRDPAVARAEFAGRELPGARRDGTGHGRRTREARRRVRDDPGPDRARRHRGGRARLRGGARP